MKQSGGLVRVLGGLVQAALAVGLAAGMTFAFFLTLPLLQRMGRPPEPTLEVRSLDTTVLAPPPPPQEEEREEEAKQDEPPPTELTEQAAPPMDLSQLEMALDPGFGDGGGGALAGGRLAGAGGDAEREKDADAVFSMADLDQAPKVVSQPPPQYPASLRSQKLRGTVHVLFMVDRNGRVVTPQVQKSTHAAFEKPALESVRQWRFEPGKRSGQAVQFRMRVPITFACG
jgi:protein TonB